jgi:hypothetical protein
MTRVLVDSTSVISVSYCSIRTLLDVEFRDGTRYQFFAVPEERFQDFVSADSKGSFFNRQIRNHFPFQRISPSSTPPSPQTK